MILSRLKRHLLHLAVVPVFSPFMTVFEIVMRPVDARAAALRCICSLGAAIAAISGTQIVQDIIKILSEYPREGSTIMTLAASAAAMFVNGHEGRQEIFRSNGGLTALQNVLEKKKEEDIFQPVYLAIANTCYQNQEAQAEILELGILDQLFRSMSEQLQRQLSRPVLCSMLQVCINAVSSNEKNQSYFCQQQQPIVQLISSLLDIDHTVNVAGAEGSRGCEEDHASSSLHLPSLACLLTSHLAENNPTFQAMFVADETNIHKIILAIDAQRDQSHLEQEQGKDPEDLRLHATHALVNLSYHNPRVQQIAAEYTSTISRDRGGIEIVLELLGTSAAYDVQKAATFASGNLVMGNRDNAMRVARANGIPMLSFLVNDDDDDDLSKKAFHTLTAMGDVAAEKILAHIAKCALRLREFHDRLEADFAEPNTQVYASVSAAASDIEMREGSSADEMMMMLSTFCPSSTESPMARARFESISRTWSLHHALCLEESCWSSSRTQNGLCFHHGKYRSELSR